MGNEVKEPKVYVALGGEALQQEPDGTWVPAEPLPLYVGPAWFRAWRWLWSPVKVPRLVYVVMVAAVLASGFTALVGWLS